MALHSEYEICWKDFRGFLDTGWVTIKPLTIIIGANNSGKSSLLTPLLLMHQTLVSRDTSSALITKGSLVDLGSFEDMVHNYSTKNQISFGFRYHTHNRSQDIGPVGSYPPGAFNVEFGIEGNPPSIVVKSYELFDIYKRSYLKLKKTINAYELSGIPYSKMRRVELDAIRTSVPYNFLFSPTPALSFIEKETKSNEGKKPSIAKRNKVLSSEFTDYIRPVGYSFTHIRSILTDLSYIGPIREQPHRWYEASGEIPRAVGVRGENMPSLLKYRHKELQAKLNYWIKRFEFGETLKVEPLTDSENLFSILFKDANRKATNLASSGFGASQVLPLITQAVAAKPGSWIIAEQPEIHLNPKLQCELADLFIFMANNDQRVLVETHSEHLLLRIRRLVAEKKADPKKIAIFYVEKRDGKSTIREISIDNKGYFDKANWPKGFFEDGLRESFGLVRAQVNR